MAEARGVVENLELLLLVMKRSVEGRLVKRSVMEARRGWGLGKEFSLSVDILLGTVLGS